MANGERNSQRLADIWTDSSDPHLQPQPVVASTNWGGDNNLEVTLRQSTADGPIMMGSPNEQVVHHYLEKVATGERHVIGSVRYLEWLNRCAVYDSNGAGDKWLSSNGPNPVFNAGFADWCKLLTSASSGAGFVVEIRTPYAWWDLDIAELLFLWMRFYSGGATAARDTLDKQALLDYSKMNRSVLTAVRLWAWRKPEEQLDTMIVDLAAQAGALLGWGGFNDAGTIQGMRLRVLHMDSLEVSTLGENGIIDLAVGRREFILGPAENRIAEDYVLNDWRTKWGGFQVNIREGSDDPGSSTDEFPATEVNDFNVLTHESTASKADYGIRNVERELPNICQAHYAENSQKVDWWSTQAPREVQLQLGPLHYDFDPGAIIHASDPDIGLDGTEALLVTSKAMNLSNHTASITCIEIQAETFPSMDPDDAEISGELILWLEGDTGVTATAGAVSTWADSSSEGNDAIWTGRGSATTKPQVLADELGTGLDALDFDQSGGSGLDIAAFSGGIDDDLGKTVFALVKHTGTITGKNLILHSHPTGAPYGYGSLYFATDTYWCHEVDTTVHFENGTYWVDDSILTPDVWHLVVFTSRPVGGSIAGHSSELQVNAHDLTCRLDKLLTLETASEQDLTGATYVGADGDGSNPWNGPIAALVAYNSMLTVRQIRGVLRYLDEKWGPF